MVVMERVLMVAAVEVMAAVSDMMWADVEAGEGRCGGSDGVVVVVAAAVVMMS
jgi:hypothetical protein